jgi:hypothetical protein
MHPFDDSDPCRNLSPPEGFSKNPWSITAARHSNKHLRGKDLDAARRTPDASFPATNVRHPASDICSLFALTPGRAL